MAWFEVAVASGTAPVVDMKYIKATGCQFAIPCYANEDLKFELKIRRNSNGGDIVASAHGWNEYLCEAFDDGYTLYTAGNGVNVYGASQNVGKWDTIILNKNDGVITVNGVTTTQATVGAIGGSKQLYMLGVNNTRFLCADIQYIKIYKNDTLFIDLVPAQTSGGVGCFKDTLSGTEYVSSTSSPLIYMEEASGGHDMHNYSETEQQVGTWIDGSDIYEKTVELPSFTIPTNDYYTFTISDYIQDVDMVIDGTARIYFNNTYAVLPYQAIAGQYYMVLFDANEGQFRFSRNGSSLTVTKAYVTLQYTKT